MYYEKSEDRILEAKPVVYDGAMVVFNPKFFEDVGKIPGIMSTEWYREGRDMALNKTRILVRAESDSPDWRLLCGDRLVGRTWGVSKRGFGTFQLAKEIKVPLLLPVQSAPEEQPAGKKPTEEAAKTTAKQLDEDTRRAIAEIMAEESAEKEEKEMSEKKNLLSEVLEPVEDGAKMAGSSEAAELLVRTFHHALSKSKPAWAEILKRGGMDFHHVQAAILAAGVKVLVSVWPNLPKAATAKEIADLALRFESAMILKPLFGHVAEFIEALVSGGSSLLSGVRDASGSRKGTTMVRINVAE